MHILFLDLGSKFLERQEQLYYLAKILLDSSKIIPFIACPIQSILAQKCKDTIPLIPLKGKSSTNPLILLQIEKALRKYSINTLHTNDAQSATIGAFSKVLHTNQLMFIHNKRTSESLPTGTRLKKYFLADGLIALSEEIRSKIVEAGIIPEKVYTIHSCINDSIYIQKKERHDGRFVFQCTGDLIPQKGYSVLLKAMHMLKKITLPPWEVRIVGSGSLFNSLLSEAFELDVASNLALLGQQNNHDLLPLADAIVVPSIANEGSSMAIKEGWATGIPVIASDLESNTELIQDHINGLIVPVGDPEGLALAMLQCMQNKNLCDQLIYSGKQSIAKFTIKAIGKKYLYFYEHLKSRYISNIKKDIPAECNS